MLERLFDWFRLRKLERVRIPEVLWLKVEARLTYLAYLEPDDRARLRDLARGFLAAKEFHGARELVLTNEIMLSIALQACLPILHSGLDAYRDWIGVVVYPGDFVVPRSEVDEDGVVHEFDDEVLGEAWQAGPVLVSWHDGYEAPDGVNVVIHEFAHKLDMSNGAADGLPPLHAGMSLDAWANAFEDAFETLVAQLDEGAPPALDPYAAEHPAEFFAVASEAFFETPGHLQNVFPAVYEQLRLLYRVDPAEGERRIVAGSADPQTGR